ncbi:MAG: double-strand break repair helicase AddA, partial [Alphaproteobacteria bacterium]|nr:double-strand break repair helicase AddA [Alphaproteobacteria bacterium]
DLSFRSTADVLQAVDLIFRDPAAHRGLTQEPQPTVHEALEGKGPGEVQLWPAVAPADTGDERDWTAPVDHASEPAIVLAGRIAGTIAGWINNAEMLEAKGRPVRAGDIMVLVRKRGPFIHALSRGLKELGVAVAGTDRIRLAEHIAVMDLMVLGRVCLQPADDLSLAALLRSPLFDVSEEELARIAIGRPAGETLWRALRRHAETDSALAVIVAQLDD